MPDLEDRVSELERLAQGILAELGGLAIQLAHVIGEMDDERKQVVDKLDEMRERMSTLLSNMAQNALENRRRIEELETKVAAILSKLSE